MTIKSLNCHCDTCLNNTCSTNQLCYAEWKLVNVVGSRDSLATSPSALWPPSNSTISPSSPFSTTPSTLSSSSSSPLSQTAQAGLPSSIKLIKDYNCFEKSDPLIIKTVCNGTVTNTSHVIRRCCQSGDYCNKDSDLLPSESEAVEIFRHLLPPSDDSPQSSLYTRLYNKFSNLPVGIQIILTILITFTGVYSIIMIQSAASKRRRRWLRHEHHGHRRSNSGGNSNISGNINSSNAFKRFLNRFLLNLGLRASVCNAPGGDSFHHSLSGSRSDVYGQRIAIKTSGGRIDVPGNVRDSGAPPHRFAGTSSAETGRCGTGNSRTPIGSSSQPCKYDEDYSEYSSIRANSDVTVFDTNSMASREPLINAQSRMNSRIDNLVHQRSGPFMGDETYSGRVQSTLQMSLGSAAEEIRRQEASSGSGAGQPYLTQRSIAHDIQLVEVVGQGFFGVVWRGEYKGEPVAVKIFSSAAESSWEREAKIYQTTMLRHKNILGFVATDKRHDAAMAGFWLVTDYYPIGSLYDFLKVNTLSMADAIRMAFSIANGLTHLHMEIFGTRGKPAISHRDLKSKNILVKNDGTCCIADLGMAVRYNSHTGVVDVPTNTRIGTRRYLAPEILENKLDLMDFESVKATDIYALGLVLWEILRRACLSPHPDGPNISVSLQQKLTASTTPSGSGGVSPKQAHQSNISPVPAPRSEAESESARVDLTDEDSGSGCIVEKQEPASKRQRSSTSPLLQQSEQLQASVSREIAQPRPPLQSLPPQQQRIYMNESMDTTLDDTNSELAFICEAYEAPYQQYVPMDPGTEDMREVVCVRKIRPALSTRWSKFASMRDYMNLMTECWYEKPQARLSALRVRKSLSDVARKYFNMNMEYD